MTKLRKLNYFINLCVKKFTAVAQNCTVKIYIFFTCILRVEACAKLNKRSHNACLCDSSVGWLINSYNGFKQCTLTCTVKTHNSELLTFFYLKCYIVKRLEFIYFKITLELTDNELLEIIYLFPAEHKFHTYMVYINHNGTVVLYCLNGIFVNLFIFL